LETEQVGPDASGEPARVSHAMSEDSLECWPSLIHGSTSVLLPAEESNIRFMLWASFAEIYNEQIFDLLDMSTVPAARMTRPSNLQLRDGDGRPYISGLRQVLVSSAEEAWRLVQIGRENQHIASTRLNRASSRSHSIFTLRLIQVVDVDQPNVARVASLYFCDLAGSERNTASAGCNERLREAGNINLSLMTLGRCIEALRQNQARRDQSTAPRASIVPFRNSRLTRMFQSFLCGEGRVIMITNVSPCANVFDETLHAVNYSALASQVVVGPSAAQYAHSTSILPVPAHTEKHKVSLLGKHEAAAATSKVVVEKKRKCDTMTQDAKKLRDNTIQEEEDDRYSSDEDVPDSWNDDRQKLLSVIEKLQKALAEERQSKNESETRIRSEVCGEMQKQLVHIESEYQENIRRREEILEEKYDRKMEIYMEAVQKSCKRKRPDDDDDYIPSVELHAAEVKLSRYADEVNALKNNNEEMRRELTTARENISKLSAERDALAERLTKSEFSASDTLHQEKIQARTECAKLRQTLEELTNKLSDTEHRHEVTCRQLRRDKAQLEQRLNAAEKTASSQDHQPQNVCVTNSEFDENEIKSQMAKITELEAALKKERDTINHLEQCLNDAKAAEKTWAEHCKEVEAVCQAAKTSEVTKLREEYHVLECKMQEAIAALEEERQNRAQAEEMLQTVRNELSDKETVLKEELTSVSDGFRDEIKRLTDESENVQKNLTAKLDLRDKDCEKLKAEIGDLKQQASATADSSQDKVSAVQHKLDVIQEKLKQLEEEKAAAVDLLNGEIARKNAQLLEERDELGGKASEIVRLEKELEVERGRRCQLEDTIADCEKILTESKSDLCQEKDKYSALQSSLEKLQNELDITKNARKTAEEEIAGHLSAIALYEAKMEKVTLELDVMKEQLQNCNYHEINLRQQISSSSQLIKELQEKDESRNAELALRDDKLQACHTTINDLKQKIEEEQKKLESALKDTHLNEEVIAQMKLTITEQEMTMQAQDQMVQEHVSETQSLKEKLDQLNADHQHQSEALNDQLRQKNTRIRELEKQVEKVRKSCECLEKDVRDTISELKTSEHNLGVVKKELASANEELERLKSDETDAKSLTKQLCQRELELSNLRKQLEVAQNKLQKRDREMEKLNKEYHAFRVDKDIELSAWHEERDRIVTELEKSISEKVAEIEHLKAADGLRTGRGKREKHPSSEGVDQKMVETLQKKVEQLSRATSVNDQAIVDMREQNLQLQRQICQLQQQTNVSEAEVAPRKNDPRRSRIPTSQRAPLRAIDGNANVSVGVSADGGVAVDLDETVGASR